MTLQITLAPETEAKLRERAAAAGQDVATFVQDVVERMTGTNERMEQSPMRAGEQWDRLREWMEATSKIVSKSLPRGTFVDDSRESIYAGQGE